MKQMVVYGSPVAGFVYYGPFDDFKAADEWAKETMTDCDFWWIVELISPENVGADGNFFSYHLKSELNNEKSRPANPAQ